MRPDTPHTLRFRSLLAPFLAAGLLMGLTACATQPLASDKDATADYNENNDPYEPANRVFYGVTAGLDTVLVRPLAVGYRNVVPDGVRHPVDNLLGNLQNPVILANDALQAHPHGAENTAMRLLINTTLGVGGLFDVASKFGYRPHDNTFGTTLALWGVPAGPYLYLPVLGPSNPRDATGYGVDVALNPITWPENGYGFNTFRITTTAVSTVNSREKALDITNSIDKTSLDPYATYRSLYQQHRQSVIEEARHDVPAAP